VGIFPLASMPRSIMEASCFYKGLFYLRMLLVEVIKEKPCGPIIKKPFFSEGYEAVMIFITV
jgi:hypothetical protein